MTNYLRILFFIFTFRSYANIHEIAYANGDILDQVYDLIEYISIEEDLIEQLKILKPKISPELYKHILNYAYKFARLETVKYLISEENATITKNLKLHIGCLFNCFNLVKHAIEKDHMDINLTDINGNTPLHIASYYSDKTLFLYLVNNGANLIAINDNLISPFTMLCMNGRLDLIKYLVKRYPVLMEIPDNNGRYSLEYLPSLENNDLQDLFYSVEKTFLKHNVFMNPKFFGTKIDSESTQSNIKNKQQIIYFIRTGDIHKIKDLEKLSNFFSRIQIAEIIIDEIYSDNYDENKVIDLIKVVSLSFNLAKLKDRYGKNLLWHALNIYNMELCALLILLCKNLINKKAYTNSIEAFLELSNRLLRV